MAGRRGEGYGKPGVNTSYEGSIISRSPSSSPRTPSTHHASSRDHAGDGFAPQPADRLSQGDPYHGPKDLPSRSPELFRPHGILQATFNGHVPRGTLQPVGDRDIGGR